MKLQCIIISLTIVGVSAITSIEYNKSVHVTNLFMAQAQVNHGNVLKEIIKDIIYGNYPIDHSAMMLAVPDLAENEQLQNAVDIFQVALRRTIRQHFKPQISDHDANQVYRLTQLAGERRSITGSILKAIIGDILDQTVLDRNTLNLICRGLALLVHTTYTRSYTESALLDDNRMCNIKHLNKMEFHFDFNNIVYIRELVSGW